MVMAAEPIETMSHQSSVMIAFWTIHEIIRSISIREKAPGSEIEAD
jgi:hypothetical protein